MAIECRLGSIMCSENSIKSGLVLNATPRRAGNSRPTVPKSKAFHGNCAFSGSSLRPKRNLIRAESIDYSKEFRNRSSADEVCKEMQKCYELINNIGRGVVYLGSSRTQPDHPHFLQAMELGRELSYLLECTSWSGVGPGLMDAAVKGALQAGKPVGGFKIAKEAGEWTSSNFHPYLSSGTYLTCRHTLIVKVHSETTKQTIAALAVISTVMSIIYMMLGTFNNASSLSLLNNLDSEFMWCLSTNLYGSQIKQAQCVYA